VRREVARYRKVGPKLRALGWQDWKDLVRAQLALAQAQREMRSLPTGDLVRDESTPEGLSTANRVEDARRIALAVNRAAEFGVFRPKCLVRSRALRRLLDRAGVLGAEVRVGVQLSEGRFLAHAWVEYGGQVLGDDPAYVARFDPMTDLQVASLE
jgi:hypothetical protein